MNLRNLYLIGMMGTGKSAVGKITADVLGLNFIDSDHFIENQFGLKVSEIFAEKGEQFFRRLEMDFITDGHPSENSLISCGGGLCTPNGMIDILKENGIVVTLTATPKTIYERIKENNSRPLINGADPLEKITEISNRRKYIYNSSHYSIPTDELSISEVSERIIKFYQSI